MPKNPKDKKIKTKKNYQPDIRTAVSKIELSGTIDIAKIEQKAKNDEVVRLLLAHIKGEV